MHVLDRAAPRDVEAVGGLDDFAGLVPLQREHGVRDRGVDLGPALARVGAHEPAPRAGAGGVALGARDGREVLPLLDAREQRLRPRPRVLAAAGDLVRRGHRALPGDDDDARARFVGIGRGGLLGGRLGLFVRHLGSRGLGGGRALFVVAAPRDGQREEQGQQASVGHRAMLLQSRAPS